VVLPAPGGASITKLGLRCRDEMISGNRTSTGRGDVRLTHSIEHDQVKDVNRPHHRALHFTATSFSAIASGRAVTPID
jgi:hypothetical protein